MRKGDYQKMELTNSPEEDTALKCLLKIVSQTLDLILSG